MPHQPIEELQFFLLFESVAAEVWNLVAQWPRFTQNTIGEQLVRAIDSVNADLVEGDGRYAQADSIRFFIIARASAREARQWIKRATKRQLIPANLSATLLADLEKGAQLLNLFINYRRSAKFVNEERSEYLAAEVI